MNQSNRKHNFSAGPCTLPLEALEEAQAEFVDYQGAGMSLIEMSHRGKHFDDVANEAMALSMEVFQAPDDFAVLLLQGGAILQFSMVPMNLLNPGSRAAYINSGSWAKGAITDAKQYGDVYLQPVYIFPYRRWCNGWSNHQPKTFFPLIPLSDSSL